MLILLGMPNLSGFVLLLLVIAIVVIVRATRQRNLTDRTEAVNQREAAANQMGAGIVTLALAGAFIGGIIGFFLRPSAPLIGQLPFETVISRGSNLRGLDQLLVSYAEMSFNYMMIGAALGSIGGGLLGYTLSKKNTASVLESRKEILVDSPRSIKLGLTPEQVGDILGRPEKMVNLGSKEIYIYRDMKIIFVDGKVSDVQ